MYREHPWITSLKTNIPPGYWIQSDDSFLRDQLEDALIQGLRTYGFDDIIRYQVGIDFDEVRFKNETSHMNLFSSKKIIRIRSEKPLDAGLGDFLTAYLTHPMPEYCLIINSGRTSGSPKWAQALSAHTQHITLWPPSLQEFPDFIQKQAQGCGLRFSSPQLQRITAAYEGNLAGFSQFLIQLSTSQHSTPPRQDGTPSAHHSRQPSPQVISDDMLESHLMTFAQFNLFEAAPAILSGDLTRVHAILSYFEMHEPQDLVPLLSILAKEFRTLHACIVASKATNLATVFKAHHIWPKAQPAYQHAIRHLTPTQVLDVLLTLTELDDMAKGLIRGNPWNALHQMSLALWTKQSISPIR